MISMIIIVLLHIRTGIYLNQIKCVADGFIFSSAYWFFGVEIAILTNFTILTLNKNEFNINTVLKQKSRALLWIKQIFSNCIISILTSIWIALCTYFASGLMTVSYINWNSVNSIFFKVNKVICSTLALKDVVILFLIYSTLKIFIVSISSLLIYWLTNRRIISLIFIIILGVLENSIPIIYRVINIDYGVIGDSRILMNNFLYGLLLIVVLTILGLVLGKRKEFYGEVQ